VPLEKTLQTAHISYCGPDTRAYTARDIGGLHLHEQAGLSTGTVTDDYELSSNFSHVDVCEGVVVGVGRGLGSYTEGRESVREMATVGRGEVGGG
jgi:hypothetical protein